MYDLNKFTRDELCEIWDTLNDWRWPERLLGEKPANWDNLPNYNKGNLRGRPDKDKILAPIMHEIEESVPNKALLRWANVYGMDKNKTLEEFEQWWQEEYLGRL